MKRLTDSEILTFVRDNWDKFNSSEMVNELQGLASKKRIQKARGIVSREKKKLQASDEVCIKYIANHWQSLSDSQMAKALGTYADRIKKLRLEMGLIKKVYRASGTLCWSCANATSLYRCKYVRSCINHQKIRYYEGTEVSNGRIISCPKFESDE